jgi:cytochrome P450
MLFLLAQHPKVYACLVDELTGLLHGATPTYKQLEQLPLLEGVVKEGLRLVPPVVWGIRYSVEDFDLGGYHFEKGSSVMYSSHVTHHMPEIYRDPYKFDPFRWETIRPSAYEYFPFNAGPRRCLGAEFAMMELRITLAILLQRFHITLLPGQRIDRVGLTGSIPKQGIRIKLESMDRPYTKVPVRGNVHKLVDLT